MSASVRPIIAGRPVLGFDRDAIRRRNRHAFAAGDQCRRHDTAAALEALATELRTGRHGELVLAAAAALIQLRRRGAS